MEIRAWKLFGKGKILISEALFHKSKYFNMLFLHTKSVNLIRIVVVEAGGNNRMGHEN